MPMFKRTVCCILAALLILGMLPGAVLHSAAAENRTASEACIEILKKMEGFLEKPVADNGQYTVGYGTACGKDDYPNGITEEEADALLRAHMARIELSVNKFLQQYQIVLAQNQFDALMLFTYNCGTGWLYGNGEFRQAVLDDLSGNNFIFYMSQWSAAGGDLLPSLITRRLIESDMYLNGSYTNEKPENYSFVYFDYNGGDGNVRVQGYDWDLPAYVKPAPTRDEYRFMGWYTEAEEGTWVTELSAENAEQTLYAHWQGPDVFVRKPVAVSYQIPSELLASRELFDVPNGTPEGKLTEGAVAEIRGEYVDENGVKWGKLSNNSWVNLGDPRIGTGDETEHKTGVKVVVTGDYLNVRVAPGAQYKAIAGVLEGDEIVITETVDVAGVLWGKFRAGWVCLQYTDYAGGLKPGQPEDVIPEGGDAGNVVIATGTVTVGELYIRAVAGTHGYLIGAYRRGDKVEILEKTMVNGATWGRTNMGWISLAYVDLDASVQTPESTIPTETTAPETTVPETTVPETTVPETTVPETTAPEKEEQKPDTDDSQGIWYRDSTRP